MSYFRGGVLYNVFNVVKLSLGFVMSCVSFSILSVSQGGYNLTSLAQSVCQTVQSLLGDPTPVLNDIGSPCHRWVWLL